ncbi:alpha-L-fucosidase [Chitinophaga arvensicola]|uniref:alpha-L-fucosidase n=1 Tax=Chitinophaga arvensicola TaxID=29529 RepID=A0A1I0RA58_9BACT|nr:alpha-L-fucosidase [Chitinophaga arvensicola]SEW37123.1 alpha-L-fucosidase [Chitinophaga arvensicola]
MNKLFSLLGCLLYLSVTAQQKTELQVKNTYPVATTDTPEDIISKAAHVVPTPNQYRALKNEFIAFIHFGPNTFTRMEWGSGKEDPAIFNLKELHTDQWCEAMKAAGIKMVLLTVKHHDGFVLWQSRYTQHGIMSTPYKNGKGDILKELVASCKKYGLKMGVYLSPADLYQIENPEGLYGNGSKYTTRIIPRAVPGRPFSNKTTFKFQADDYNEYFLNQLFELLTEYGPMYEVWFDGAHPKTKGGQQYNYAAWRQLIHTLAPQAVIFGKEDIRWCGNESGKTRHTEWNVIPYQDDPAALNNFADLTQESLGSREELYKGRFLHYQQAETNTSIREGWFYRDDNFQKVRSADDVFDIYERAVGGNSTFLLNIPPNREGKFSPADVSCLKEVGKRITQTYQHNLFKDATGPKQVLDQDAESYVLGTNDLVITTPSPVTINRLVLQEAIATHGERVEKHALDAWVDNQWKEIAMATNIGYKRILRFPEVTSAKFRIRILASRDVPAISNISAHYYQSRPPQLQLERSSNGMVSIDALQPAFNWKPHGENALKNIGGAYRIFYTTDGSTPGPGSHEYTGAFKLADGEVKAIAIDKNGNGPVSTQRFGVIKENWKLQEASSSADGHPAAQAFDASAKTYWLSKENNTAPFISIDLGATHSLKGFAYTPQNDFPGGMMAKGIVKVSSDGKTWNTVTTFEFGNLINDPVTRYHYFKKDAAARYVRIETTEIAAGGKTVAIAELDFFE